MSTNDDSMKVTNKIGEDYKTWKNGAHIYIDAPTGTGKTKFILYKLLTYYSGLTKKKKILYLVNRRILKAQIMEMISALPHNQTRAIRVMLYQEIEKKVVAASERHDKGSEGQGYDYSFLEKLEEYDCVVCDEAHYFLMDSTYNTNTVFSFRWVQDAFQNKISIFMSATIQELKTYIETNNLYEYGKINTAYYELPKYNPSIAWLIKIVKENREDGHSELEEQQEPEEQQKIPPYEIEKDYTYIKAQNIRIITNREQLVDLVAEGNHKWLIFVDNIKYGKNLENSIKKKLNKDRKNHASERLVKFISSGYKWDQDSTDEVDRIIRTQAASVKVLIVTAVLDNGVNILDINVRNVVLFADTETEFIQMLGRKRKDAQQFKLYIYGYNKEHFIKRKRQLIKQKGITDRYLSDIEEKIDKLEMQNNSRTLGNENNENNENNKSPLFTLEEECIDYQHRKMMQEIFDGYIKFEDVRHAFTVYDGKFHLSMMSFQHIENLNIYFQDIIRKFEEEGEDAFAREQLRWIGKTGKVAEEIIKKSKQMGEIESRKRIIASLNEIVGKKKLREEFSKFTDRIIKDLRTVVAQPVDFPDEKKRTNEQFENWNTVKREFTKTGKVISKQSMEFLRTYCRIPFQVETDRQGGYTVKHASLNKNNE